MGAQNAISLQEEMVLQISVKPPAPGTAGSPFGERRSWEISSAQLEGTRIQAQLVQPGLDWMLVGADGFWRPDVRVTLRTSDGAMVLLRYRGLIEATESFVTAAQSGQQTQFGDTHMRLSMEFETGDARYAWLNQRFFLAEGRLAGPLRLEYRVYRMD